MAVKAQKLDGAAVAQLSVEKLTSFSQAVAEGDALLFAQSRDTMFRQVMPGTREFAASHALADLRASMSSSPTAALDLLATAGGMPFDSPQEVRATLETCPPLPPLPSYQPNQSQSVWLHG